MEEIYNEYSRIVFKYLVSYTNNTELAEELTQETFYKAVKNINKFRNESSMKTWLCKIAKNVFIDYFKKKNNVKEVNINEITDLHADEKSLEEQYENKEQLIDMYKKIHKLDETSREVVYLRLRSDLSYKEIGNILGKTEEWVRVTFYRAKLKLKEDFKDE